MQIDYSYSTRQYFFPVMTKRIQNFSGIDTVDKVSIWDQLFNSQLLTLLCNWLRYYSKLS